MSLREAQLPAFAAYQRRVVENARALAEALLAIGFKLASGGTDNHLMLVNVKVKGLTGKQAEAALDEIGVTVNKNTIPFDEESPFVTSGIRLGTPAVTTRGMGPAQMAEIATIIDDTLAAVAADRFAATKEGLQARVRTLTSAFPLYEE